MAEGDTGSFAGVGVRRLRGHLARLEARVFLEELIAVVSDWHLGDATRIMFEEIGGARVPVRFDELPVEVGP